MKFRSAVRPSFHHREFRALRKVFEESRKIALTALVSLTLIALGMVCLKTNLVNHARARLSAGNPLGSASWWHAQSVHAQGGGNSPTFVTFEAPDAGSSMLQGTTGLGINAEGDIVGTYVNMTNLAHGFVRSGATGTITEFDAPGAGTAKNEGTFAFGINTAGDIAGMYSDSVVAYHGFVRTAATQTITQFDVPGAPTTVRHRGTIPFAIDTAGDITGYYVDTSAIRHGFLRTIVNGNPTYTTFDAPNAGANSTDGTVPLAIDAGGDVTGYYKDSAGTFHGFIRTASTGTITAPIDVSGAGTAPGGNGFSFRGTLPTCIDTAGDIAGIYADTNGLYHGFIRVASTGTITAPLDSPGSATGGLFPGTLPAGFNDSGVISGVYEDANGLNHAFVRSAGGTFTAPLNAPNASTTSIGIFPGGTVAVGINDSGIVTGGYLDASGVGHGFALTPAQAAAPTFNPPAGNYAATQSVTLSDSTVGAVIYYTTDGSTPTTSSPVYSGPISVTANETIQAIATAIPNWLSTSTVASAAYTIGAAPDFTVMVSPTSLTIVAGQSGQATFTVTPENGFDSEVTFACSGLPAEASCSFNPPNVTPNPPSAVGACGGSHSKDKCASSSATSTNGSVSTVLTVSTTAPSSALPRSTPSPGRPIYTISFSLLIAILAIVSCHKKALRVWQFLALGGFLVLASALVSCSPSGNPGTPAGTTSVSVSASANAGGPSHGAALMITITQ